jgi:ABC-type transport system involved in multi-copper enzyme maturation permease subunit
MREFVFGTLLCGLRARSLQAVFALGLILIVAALLAGSFSARQPQTVVLDVGLSCLRFSLVLLGVFWIQELVAKEIDRRTVIFALTYPVPRYVYLLGRYFGILLLLAAATLIQSLLLGIATTLAGSGYQQLLPVTLGYPYWVSIFGIWLDVAVVCAFTLWISTLSTVSILPIALGASFAVSGRALGAVLQYLLAGADGDQSLTGTYLPILNVVQWVLPDLSRLDWRLWPMYGDAPEVQAVLLGVLMALSYSLAMLGLAVRSFSRREFS